MKAKKIVENVKQRQNQEMLVLLADEQAKDESREQELAELAEDSPSETLTSRHGRERARA